MLNLYYSLSMPLKESLGRIEQLRRQILLTPIPPKRELRLRWEAALLRIYWSTHLSGNPLSKSDMAKLISGQTKKKLNQVEKEVVNYKKALDLISGEWLVSDKNVQPKAILELYNLACSGRFRGSEADLRQMLAYLQTSSENPVIPAGAAAIYFIKLTPFTYENDKIGRLTSLLFLYKAGYDFRGMLYFEEYFKNDPVRFGQVLQAPGGNITLWLEYFALGIVNQLEKALAKITSDATQSSMPPSFWGLNERQKEVLIILEQPSISITNKVLRKRFKVSQITASRDLVKLANLRLVLAHGKGRSVYYTKV